MNRLKSSMLIMLAAIMTVGLAVIPAEPAEAQGSAALSIPPRKDYTIEPGRSVKDTLLVRNIDNERVLNLSLRVVDFTYNDDGGTPKLILDPEAEQLPWSLRSFIDLPEQVDIEPGESASIDMSVAIPEDNKAGSYYSAIIFSSSPSEGGNVGLSASGVSLVFVTIPGEVEESLTLEKLGAYDANARNNDGTTGKYRFFNLNMPLRVGYTLRNDGNVAESPVGSITLQNLFGGSEVVINDMNPNKSLALIGQTRTFVTCIKRASQEVDFEGTRQDAVVCSPDTGLWPGIYRIEMNAFYGWNGNNTQEILGKAWMIYAPWWALLILALILLAIIYYGRKLYLFIQLKRGRGRRSTGGKRFVARGRR